MTLYPENRGKVGRRKKKEVKPDVENVEPVEAVEIFQTTNETAPLGDPCSNILRVIQRHSAILPGSCMAL